MTEKSKTGPIKEGTTKSNIKPACSGTQGPPPPPPKPAKTVMDKFTVTTRHRSGIFARPDTFFQRVKLILTGYRYWGNGLWHRKGKL